MLKHENWWMMVSNGNRDSKMEAGWDDAVPFGRPLSRRRPTASIWGTDWPHPKWKKRMMNDAEEVELLYRYVDNDALCCRRFWSTIRRACMGSRISGAPPWWRNEEASCPARRKRYVPLKSITGRIDHGRHPSKLFYAERGSFGDILSRPPRLQTGPVDPSLDYVIGVDDAIDIHCHAHEGQQDALGVAKLASKSGMAGILYKTIVRRKDPAGTVGGVRSALESWCAEKGFTPVHPGPAPRSPKVFSRSSIRRGLPKT